LQNNVPKSEPLIFPRGVRFPRKNEIPGDPTEVLERVSRARIMTGYKLQKTEGKPFDTYIEANVHASSVFDVFRKLSFALMPDVAAPLIGIKEDEPVFGPYTDLALALAMFEPYIDLLQNDGFLEFGLVHQSKLAFEEIFVASSKYFKIWTNNSGAAQEVLQKSGIPESEALEFIDEYPMVSLSVDRKRNAAWGDPYYSIQNEFAKLPKAKVPRFET
jgi:hypothetical protein